MYKAILVLEDGTVYEGYSQFEHAQKYVGELVFNTSMTGYQEVMTDPSYAGQIVMFTQPHIGNYGVSSRDDESDGIKAAGLVAREVTMVPSNHRSESSLTQWLGNEDVPAFWGIDTRELTRRIRDKGALLACIATGESHDPAATLSWLKAQPKYGERDFVSEVSVSEPLALRLEGQGDLEKVMTGEAGGTKHVVVVDYGVKRSIVRNLLRRGVNVTLVPNSYGVEEIERLRPDGVLLSNGPGDPQVLSAQSEKILRLTERWPTWGICLGHQLLALAFGGKTYKLKFGHRGPNQPVQYLPTGKVEMTSQNHGYAVSELPEFLELTHINLNDETIEGFRHKDKNVEAVQFHPEAGPGPHDAENFFDRFCGAI